MIPGWHILFGAVFSLFLFFFFSASLLNSAIVFLTSVLIDFDHYLLSIRRLKSLSLRKSYNWYLNLIHPHKPALHIFHTVEFIIFILILAFFHEFFLFILIGILFHSLLDIIEMSYHKFLSDREYFLTRYLLNKNKSKYL
ncbi:MAG: hypothetical protein KKB21_04190 [Nanoarchaeota archaeon]|nr:hypothetical protein [Nanoarchaeota archaeon]